MAAGSEEYGWHIDLGKVAAIWRAGCIIRAAFLDRITHAYETQPQLPSLLSDKTFAEEIATAQDDWRHVIATAVTQGQRDYFGAHTYHRTDREGSFTLSGAATRGRSRADGRTWVGRGIDLRQGRFLRGLRLKPAGPHPACMS